MEGELFWLFYDDVFSSWIPPNHVVIFWTFKKTAKRKFRLGKHEQRTEVERHVEVERGGVRTRRVL